MTDLSKSFEKFINEFLVMGSQIILLLVYILSLVNPVSFNELISFLHSFLNSAQLDKMIFVFTITLVASYPLGVMFDNIASLISKLTFPFYGPATGWFFKRLKREEIQEFFKYLKQKSYNDNSDIYNRLLTTDKQRLIERAKGFETARRLLRTLNLISFIAIIFTILTCNISTEKASILIILWTSSLVAFLSLEFFYNLYLFQIKDLIPKIKSSPSD